MPNKNSKTQFSDSWVTNQEYCDWLRPSSSKYEAYCAYCQKSFDISNMGLSAVSSHAKGKKHCDIGKRKQTSIPLNFNEKNICTVKCQTSSACTITSSVQSDLLTHISVERKAIEAEIMWTCKLIMSKFSFRSSDDIVGLFHRMFPDSLIAQKMSLGRDKMGYSIRFGLATYFNDQLMDLALKSPAYVICFDESLNKVTQEEQMDCYVRLYNVNKNRVETRYITSTFLGHATAVHLKDAFKENCKRLDPQKMLQISMDGPNVNLKFYSDLCAELEEQDNPQLVNIGTCSLHSVHNAFKSAVKVSDSGIDSLLQSLWTLFHNTPARRQDFTNITGGVTFPLKFCAHRWTENVNVIERALLVWPQVEKYVAHVNAPGNGKMKPSSLSFATVQKAVEDPLTTCALKFFLSIAVQLQPFLKKFQSDAPLLPLFPMIMGNMLLSIMARFLKHSVMESAQNNNWKALLKIDVSRTGNYRQLDEIDFGFGMKTSLEGVSILSTPSNVLQFKVSCRRSLVTLIEKFLNRNPLNNSFVRNLACLSPETILTDPATSAKYFEPILWQLVRDKRFEEQKCDEALSQFRQLTSSQLTSFDVERDRLDDFYHNVLHEKKYAQPYMM